MADYARLLSGPKGTPVWFIDRHPMRVFKWTPDFDAYCESPIAAIWCNLIGLPIHLFDHAALFANGKLLGNPIQVDQDTANKKRLSFARLCIEIDITKPPPEEIILDIYGLETVQQVRWGKIPSYCRDCKHVGHTRDVCYASGKMERPEKRDYSFNKAAPKQKPYGDQGGKGNQDQSYQKTKESERGTQGKNHANGLYRSGIKVVGIGGLGESSIYVSKGKEEKEPDWSGPDIMGESRDDFDGELRDLGGIEGSDRSKGMGYCKSLDLANIPRESEDTSNLRGFNHVRRELLPSARGGSRGAGRPFAAGGQGNSAFVNYLSSNKYFSLMESGEFDVDECGESEALEMDVQPSIKAIVNTPLCIEGGSDC